MYFASRLQAGRALAARLAPNFQGKPCVVVALSDGGVMVGAQIAEQLHCMLTMLLSEEVMLPREPVAVGGITSEGSFVYNNEYSAGEIDELSSEYHNTIEQEKITKLHELNQLLGRGGLINRTFLKERTVILVSDGMKTGFQLDMALQFLKPVDVESIVVATPLASVSVVDQLHVNVDEIYCLDVPAEYLDTDHYYDKHDIPDHKTAVHTIENLLSNWQEKASLA